MRTRYALLQAQYLVRQLNRKKAECAGYLLLITIWIACLIIVISMNVGCRTVTQQEPIKMPDVIEKPVHEQQKEIIIPVRSSKPMWRTDETIEDILVKINSYVLRLEVWADSITRRVEASNNSIQ